MERMVEAIRSQSTTQLSSTEWAHPGGGRLETEVRHVMRPGVVTVTENTSLTQLHRAMVSHVVHAVLIVGACWHSARLGHEQMPPMSSATHGPIGSESARRRLEHREQPIVLMLAALPASEHERARGHSVVPPPRRRSVMEFEGEPTKVRRRLGRRGSRG